MTKYLVKIGSTERTTETEQEILQWFLVGQCFPGNFVFHFDSNRWTSVAELPLIAPHFANKPSTTVEKSMVYVMSAGKLQQQEGPYSLATVKSLLANGSLCGLSWIFVDGDKEWRQVQQVKLLRDLLPPLPAAPATSPAASPPTPPAHQPPHMFSSDDATPIHTPAPALASSQREDGVEYAEEETKAFSALGLSLEVTPIVKNAGSAPPVQAEPKIVMPTPAPKSPVPHAAPVVSAAPKPNDRDQGSYDGITAEISSDPIWVIKKNESEQTMGPFRYLEVMKFLEEGKVFKNDKISKVGSNRFCKILQQYEFNVKYTLETVVEAGIEQQKIFIRRRHPRVPYMADVQVTRNGATVPVSCVNLSAGGILVETRKVEFKLGETIDIKILPGLINRTILCKAMVIGKIPKIPPGYALKFEELKKEDKEAIEYFVQNALKKEQSIRA